MKCSGSEKALGDVVKCSGSEKALGDVVKCSGSEKAFGDVVKWVRESYTKNRARSAHFEIIWDFSFVLLLFFV